MNDVPKLKPIFPFHVLIWTVVGPLLSLMGILLERTLLSYAGLIMSIVFLGIALVTGVAERKRHDRCHHMTERGLDALRQMHAFQIVETVATELDTWSDSFRGQPKGAFVSVQQLADGLESRARELRRMAPEPPKVRIDKDNGLMLDIDRRA